MAMFGLRVSDQLKRRMDRAKINWSDYLRHAINEALESDVKRALIQKIHRLAGRRSAAPEGTAARLIRQLRDRG